MTPDYSSTPPHAQHAAHRRIITAIDRYDAIDFRTADGSAEYVALLRQQAQAWEELANSDGVPQWALLAARMIANVDETRAWEAEADHKRIWPTCAHPGDHEHDHRTCQDVAEERRELETALDALPDQVPADPEDARDVNRTATALWAELEDTEDRANTPDCYDCNRQWADCTCDGPQT